MVRISTIAWIVWLELLRRKDVYVLLILLGVLLFALGTLDIFGLAGVVGYVKDIGLMLAWLFGWILGVTAGARELPREESRGTIFPLLAKPVRRLDIVLGKWLGAWSVVTASTLLFYLLVCAVVLLAMTRDMTAAQVLNPAALAQGFILHALALAVVVAVALAFSTRMNYDAAATLSYVVTAAAFFVVPRVPEFLVQQKGLSNIVLMALYHLLPHFELFDMRKRIVHDYGPIPTATFLMVLAYGLLLCGVILALAWCAYRRKLFSRSTLAQ